MLYLCLFSMSIYFAENATHVEIQLSFLVTPTCLMKHVFIVSFYYNAILPFGSMNCFSSRT